MGSIRRINGKITKEYQAWKAMKARCYAPSTERAYKEKGIIVCQEWINSFEKFLEDMRECPTGFSLDRINNDGNYEKSNCRWTNDITQTSNRGAFNKLFTHNGETKVLKQWAKDLGFSYNTLYSRIYRSGLAFEEAIKKDPFNKLIMYKGKTQTMKEWCIELNLPYNTMADRRFQGWKVEDIFERTIKKVKI